MQKTIKGFLAGFMAAVMLLTGVSVFAQGINVSFKSIKILINGQEKKPTADMQPLIYNGRTYVALRFIGEAFNKNVNWNGASTTITIDDKQQENLQNNTTSSNNTNKNFTQKEATTSFISFNNTIMEYNVCQNQNRINYPFKWSFHIIEIEKGNETKHYLKFVPYNCNYHGRPLEASGELYDLCKLIKGVYQTSTSTNPYVDKKVLFFIEEPFEISINRLPGIYVNATDSYEPYTYIYQGKEITTPDLKDIKINSILKSNSIEFYFKSLADYYVCIEDVFKYWNIDSKISYVEEKDIKYLKVE